MTKKKTWLDKLIEKNEPQTKRIEIKFADMPAGSNMFIATPQLIDQYIQEIGFGKCIDTKTLRKDLALEHNADYTCPVTTGIFFANCGRSQLRTIATRTIHSGYYAFLESDSTK